MFMETVLIIPAKNVALVRWWEEPAKGSDGGRGWLASGLTLWAPGPRKPEENVV